MLLDILYTGLNMAYITAINSGLSILWFISKREKCTFDNTRAIEIILYYEPLIKLALLRKT